MGFNLLSGHHTEVFKPEYAEQFAQALQQRFGVDVPLGAPGNVHVEPAQMGWSWWDDLKTLAKDKLGEEGSKHICAVDAWCGVYVDAPVEKEVLRPVGTPEQRPTTARVTVITAQPKPGLLGNIKRFLGVVPQEPRLSPDVEHMAQELLTAVSGMKSEGDDLQVSSLPAVLAEAERLLAILQVRPERDAVRAALKSYEDSESNFENDPGIQCLYHLWLTGTHALQHKQPMWLVK